MLHLRSHRRTKPSPEMLAAMTAAEVGDEQYFEDPSVNELQRRMAELLGQEAWLFFTHATLSDPIALRAQSTPCAVVLCDALAPVPVHDRGKRAVHSGLVMRGVTAE